MTSPLLQASGLEHRYGGRAVLAGIDLTVTTGTFGVIAGANGAGKTTLLRVLAGLVRPSRGEVRVEGSPLRGNPGVRSRFGMVGHQSQLYGQLTVRENLELAAALFQLPRSVVGESLASLGLERVEQTEARRLSRGTAQRVAIARALQHQPALLLLDEPMTGLDVDAADRVRALLSERQRAGTTILVVTHHLAEVWPLATRALVLQGGRWVHDGPATESVDRIEAMIRSGPGGNR